MIDFTLADVKTAVLTVERVRADIETTPYDLEPVLRVLHDLLRIVCPHESRDADGYCLVCTKGKTDAN